VRPDLLVHELAARGTCGRARRAQGSAFPAACIVDLFAIDEVRWIGQPGYADRICVLNEKVRQFLLQAGPPAARSGRHRQPARSMPCMTVLQSRRAAACAANGWDDRRVSSWPAGRAGAASFRRPPGDPSLPHRVLDSLADWTLRQDDAVLCVRARAGQALPHLPVSDRIVATGQDWPAAPLLHAVDTVVTLTSTVGWKAAGRARLVQVLGSVFDDAMPLERFGLADAAVLWMPCR